MSCLQLSIIIPHYNRPALLKKLLLSIFASDAEDYEVIVVDDNSTKDVDQYKALVEEYSTRILFLSNETGKNSAGRCRNIGLEHANGKWIIFCDADDYLFPNWHDILKEDFNSIADIIFYPPKSDDQTTGQSCGRELPFVKKIDEYFAEKNGAYSRLKYNWYVPWSKMISGQLIKRNDIRFESVMYSNDVIFSTKVGCFAQKIDARPASFYCVTRSIGGLTDSRSKNEYFSRDDVAIRNYVFLRDRITREERIDTGLDNMPINRMKMALRNRYSLSELCKLLRKFRDNKIRLITLNVIRSACRKITR